MLFTIIPCLLAALLSTFVLAHDHHLHETDQILEERQGIAQQNPNAAPTAITQAGPVTTWAIPPDFVDHVFTVTFPAVPDQWPSPGVGSIGYGTLHQKRDQAPPAPTLTGIAGRVRAEEH